MKAKISIIVPVYNDEKYLNRCLDSLISQTLNEIEIICVNDASTDTSLSILDLYAKRDSRIRVFSYSTNKSASQARKEGVLAATGQYILFVDSDDMLESFTCEELFTEMDKEPVDILHFGSYILNNMNLEEWRIRNIEQLVSPYIGKLYGEDIFDACFLDKKYQFTLWNKMYSADICKQAFSKVKDEFLPKAQDLYAYFLLAYYAKSYRGISKKYYKYNYGCGITGSANMSVDNFWRFCHQSRIPKKLFEFVDEEGLGKKYYEVCTYLEHKLLNECVHNWAYRLELKSQAKGYDLLVQFWGLEKTVSMLEDVFYQKRDFVAEKIINSKQNSLIERPIHTIGIYYHRISNGGVQRVISRQIPMLLNMGYKVVLITDEEPNVNDYELPLEVKRVAVANCFKVIKGNYYDRALSITQIIKENNIDLIIDHAFALHILFWDLCMIRGNGIPVILCTHSVFSFFLVNSNFEFFMQIPWVYRMCNKIITLSSVDKMYYDLCGLKTEYIPNPVEVDIDRSRMTKFENDNVLWVGRISEEKKPFELIKAFSKVVKVIPTAKLYMVGDGEEKYVQGVRQTIEKLGLTDSIIICGFRKDVDSFYEKAAIYLSTSLYEGFSMTNVESKLFGVPSVMFELPYLELLRDKRGYIAVKQGDYQKAADEIIYLLKDRKALKQLGEEARISIEEFAKVDYIAAWKKVICEVYETLEVPIDSSNYKMLEAWFFHWRIGNEKVQNVLNEKQRLIQTQQDELERQKEEIRSLRNSHSYKIGHMLMYLPGIIKYKLLKMR